MTIRIPNKLIKQMLRQAEHDYPHECCGVLTGHRRGDMATAENYRGCENQHQENPERRFLIDPRLYQRIEDQADAEGRSVLSIVHSHPDHPDEPSEFDRLHAWPGLSYVIISVQQGQAASYRSWQLSNDRQRFEPETIQT